MRSIRKKVLFTLIGALLIAGFMTVAATFFSAQAEFTQFLDTHLKDTAESLKESVTTVVKGGPIHRDHLTIIGDAQSYHIIVQVYDSTSNTVWVREGSQHLPVPDSPGFSTDNLDGTTWRSYTVAAGPLIITVGQDIAVRTQLAVASAFRILQPLCFLLPFICIAVWVVVGDGLTPLEKTARSVARRSPTSLEPISTKGLPLELAGLVKAINDLLERLKESLSAQQRFASDAAHELRTPLTGIKLQVQLAQRAKTPEDQAKYFARVNEGINRATRLVQQLLILARLDPESSAKSITTIRLDTMAQSIAEDMAPIAEQKNISVSAVAEACSTDGMEDAIRLMVTNLTDNAIRYTPEGGRIEIHTYTNEKSEAIIDIADNGPGIAEEERQRVFDRFYRALGTKTSGTGLGLAIVKRIVDIHHGTIAITDGLDGRGTTFRITLPKLGVASA